MLPPVRVISFGRDLSNNVIAELQAYSFVNLSLLDYLLVERVEAMLERGCGRVSLSPRLSVSRESRSDARERVWKR